MKNWSPWIQQTYTDHLVPRDGGKTQSILAYQGCSGTFCMVLDVGREEGEAETKLTYHLCQSLETGVSP